LNDRYCRGSDCQVWSNYNVHKDSGIKYVTPEQRHSDFDSQLLLNRKETYLKAQQTNPTRWRNNIRNWDFIAQVSLYSEIKAVT
jgi:hypothetical protein